MIRNVFFLIFLQLPVLAAAQFTLKVTVMDSTTRSALAGATLLQKGTNNGAFSDQEGKIILNFKNPGEYLLALSFTGYKSLEMKVNVPQTDTSVIVYLAVDKNLLEEIVVTSVRTHSTIENIPTKVEVLGLEEVTEENGIKPGSIMSLLSDVAGIQMQQVSASSGNTYARIQGLNGRYTQILRDGLPLFGGMSGELSIMQIPPLDLKQIEIIKGCGSTLYGADAIGGIINLVSKNPSEKQDLSLTLNHSSLSESNMNFYASKRYKRFGYTLFAGETVQKHRDVNKDGLSDVPDVNSFVVHPKVFYYLSPRSTLSLNYSATADKRTGGETACFSNPGNDSLYHIVNSSSRHSADIRWYYEFSENSNLTAKFSNSFLNEKIDTRHYSFNAQQDLYYSELSYFKSTRSSDWVAGINLNGDIFRNKEDGLPAIQDYSHSTAGFFIQNTWKLSEKFSAESGFREDHHSVYGNFHLPRLSLKYKFNEQFTGRINTGLGYKIPVSLSYLEPETELKNFVKTYLKPERSRSVNADINFRMHYTSDLSIIFNQAFFYTDIRHPVVDSSETDNRTVLINADRSLSTGGLQTYMRLNYSNLEFYLGYVFTVVMQNYDSLHRTPYTTPKHQFSTTCFYDLSNELAVGIESTYLAGQLDQDYRKTKDYLLLAAMIRYSFRNFDFVLNGENLLDFRQNRYEQIYDGTVSDPVFHKFWAPIDGRVINLSVKWKFSNSR
jgi:outer membrane receptor for ferrienterochelin and colicins